MDPFKHLWMVIMAGGSGTRFWPWSQKNLPKQFLPLAPGSNGQTLIQQTVSRLAAWVPHERIVIVGSAAHLELLQVQCPKIPPQNLILEPFGRNTAASVALATAFITQRDPESRQLVAAADHFIENPQILRDAVEVGLKSIQQQPRLFTFGIEPRRPETGYGYIETGKILGTQLGIHFYQARSFKEKPNAVIAQTYVEKTRQAQGDQPVYLWNSGMFLWSSQQVSQELKEHAPAVFNPIWEYAKSIPSKPAAVIQIPADFFATIPNISVDYALLEKSANVGVLRAPLSWSDLGGWQAIYELHDKDGSQNGITAAKAALGETRGTLIHCPDLEVVALGVEDLVVACHNGRLLVCRRDRVSDIRGLIDQIAG